jgi:signal transduction histidine kinase
VREAYKDLTEIVQLYQNVATAANVQLTTNAPPDLLLTAAPDMTRTILRNLTGNALKATPSGGRVVLRALPTPTSAKFRG